MVNEEVTFTTGRVASIQKVRMRRVRRDDAYGVIRVILRPPALSFPGLQALRKYAPTLKLRDRNAQGSHCEMWYFHESGEDAICKIVRALKANGHLTRHQELELYVTFELAYTAEGGG